MSLPISKQQAHEAARWLKTNFGDEIREAVKDTAFSVDLICGIACQETAYFWVSRIRTISLDEILGRCVLDASGDTTDTSRSVFPRNTAEFRTRYGNEFTDMLVNEANKTRAMRGFQPARMVYKGYGIFQYDLQFVTEDESFFRQKKWYSFEECLTCLMKELKEKYARYGNVKEAVRAYNGSGASARQYAENVLTFAQYCSEVNV